ncbi:flagellar motor protein MotB [Roseicitreum antarcticum]|uniref:Chemotaxis protein MotB n=1 Tax=Roseicitreum antarcticum TaxID=564137 RepID=A0A1H2R966_9RHOB|nr:flagellar motor protein MotB [Roseicitreum antarcticum]SDW16013.1 chemotaxis protein MotB [Roseicitreum antarcticum]
MAQLNDVRPIIIKRKKVVVGGGHHGGAWKVAYADFVTAMMAFFLMMWLLGSTDETQRKGLADYFTPTYAVHRVSAGADGALSGQGMIQNERIDDVPTDGIIIERVATALTGVEEAQAVVEDALSALSGESAVIDDALRHVVTRVTDEGLVIELFDLDTVPLFTGDTASPEPILLVLGQILTDVLQLAVNPVAVVGHTREYALVVRNNPTWELSADRAQLMRRLLEQRGLSPDRVRRVTGFADRRPVVVDPMSPRNNRLEVILLRD